MMKKLSQSPWEKVGIGFSWLSHGNNILRLSYLGIIASLPSQLGFHFWPDFSVIDGLRVDYLSPTFYLSDIPLLFLSILLIPYLRNMHWGRKLLWFILTLLGYLVVVGLFSVSPLNSLYGLVRMIGYVLFGYGTVLLWKERSMREASIAVLALAIIVSTALAIAQFVLQHSVGGIFYYLGERTFSGSTPGIANASLGGTLVLRPYASFPHPNVLAGFLLLSLQVVYFYKACNTGKWQQGIIKSSLFLGTASLFLTMSRTAIVGLVCISLWYAIRIRQFSKKIVALSLLVTGGLTILSYLLLPRFLTLSLTDEAVALRVRLLYESVKLFLHSPLVGVGIHNFLPALSASYKLPLPYSLLQPVHMIFVLILVEGGLFILLWIIPFITTLQRRIMESANTEKIRKLSLVISVIILGSFDHYLLTLHQGLLLFAFILGILWQRENPSFIHQRKQITRKRMRRDLKK